MGTRWRGLLAPINKPTGDGRRFAEDALTWRDLPRGLKWQRVDSEGHDDSVIIGLADTMNVGTVEEAIANGWISPEGAKASRLTGDEQGLWGAGELFDDQPQLPRLTEDVAEAILLTQKLVIGPSVDAGAATAVLVETGQDEPISEERMEELFWESVETGVEPDVELLFTAYEVAAATLVAIPAFAEAGPFELLPADETADGGGEEPARRTDAALVASLTAAAAPSPYPADAFTLPPTVDQIMPVTVDDRGEGFARVYGYVAAHGTCHLQFRGMCVTPPTSGTDYAVFHRYPIQTATGELVGTGRLTTGHGKVGTGCSCCPGKDDHVCDGADLTATLAHYDRLTTLAHVRAGEDARGIWVAGVAAPGLTAADLRVLGGQKFSGDWRDVGGHLELVEVLALAAGRPGFPLPATAIRDGRQVSLTAAGGIPPRPTAAVRGDLTGPLEGAFGRLRRVLDEALAPYGQQLAALSARLDQARQVADAHQAVTAADGGDVAVVSLRLAGPDRDRLAVDGGEPADGLHAVVANLGPASSYDDTTRASIITAVTAAAQGYGPINADGFALSAFTPPDGDTAVVLDVAGDEMAGLYERVTAALHELDWPDAPVMSAPHITLTHSDDPTTPEALTDRCGPVVFDTVRVTFGDQVTDLPLTPTPGQQAAALAAQIDAALAADAADLRTRTAAALIAELEEVT